MKAISLQIRRGYAAKPRAVSGLFDTGSEDGLIRERIAHAAVTTPLPDPVHVMGIGGGSTAAHRLAMFQVRVLGKWCRYTALVVSDDALDVDVLLGEDFLDRYGLNVDIRANRVVVAYPDHFRRMTRRHIFVASPRGRGAGR